MVQIRVWDLVWLRVQLHWVFSEIYGDVIDALFNVFVE
jgi:hypothetical protein